MSAASSARVLQVEGAIHTSEVAVNGRSASPWAAAGTAAARVRSSKVYGLRSKGILLAKEGNGDLSEVSGEHHKAWRMCYMRCEHLFTPLTDPIIPVAPDPPSAPRGLEAGRRWSQRASLPDPRTPSSSACRKRATPSREKCFVVMTTHGGRICAFSGLIWANGQESY